MYLLHRKITVEEPHKRNGPVQCNNCQEFGHTKTYCTLRTVCVICGELHHSSVCSKKSQNDRNLVKCSNCQGNHTANYRGCVVYKNLKQRLDIRKQMSRNPVKNTFVPLTATSSNIASVAFTPGVSYANALKTGIPSNQFTLSNSNSNLELMISTLTQSISNFMQAMQKSIDTIVEMQTKLMTALLSKI